MSTMSKKRNIGDVVLDLVGYNSKRDRIARRDLKKNKKGSKAEQKFSKLWNQFFMILTILFVKR